MSPGYIALCAVLTRVKQTVDPDRRYTVTETAALFGVGVGSVREWVAAEVLPATRAELGGPFKVGQYLILGRDLVTLARDRVTGRVRAWQRKESA